MQRFIRILLIQAFALAWAAAQTPMVRLMNVTRTGSPDFQIGDRFEVLITGAANQPVSVRTTMQGRTDWGPVAGWTDTAGQWTTKGQFGKEDFGDWGQMWTVGGKLASPALRYSVQAPCIKGGKSFLMVSGLHSMLQCETPSGNATFVTPSDTQAFQTPDGRTIPGRTHSQMTAEQFHAETMQYLISATANKDSSAGRGSAPWQRGDQAGDLITKIIGVNALSADEIRNVLTIVRAAFAKGQFIPDGAKNPGETVGLLTRMAGSSSDELLKQEIAATINYVQPR